MELFKSRKTTLFLITLIVIVASEITMKLLGSEFDASGIIVTLYATYCAGNVGTKYTNSINTTRSGSPRMDVEK